MEISEFKMSEHRGSNNLHTIRPFTIAHASPVIATSSTHGNSSSARNNYAYETSSQDFSMAMADDAKSNKSVMTTKSTREVFDLLAKLLPIGILLLIVSLSVHFVTYVKEIEPLRSISEVACMALAATVIPLSVVFIMKTMCDYRRGSNSFWYTPYEYEDTLYIQPSPILSAARAHQPTQQMSESSDISEVSQLQRKTSQVRLEPSIQTISLNDEHTLKET